MRSERRSRGVCQGNHKVTSVTKKAGEMWKSFLADQSQSFEETYSVQKASSQVCPWQHVTHLRYAPQELCLLHQCEFGVNTKLILQKHTSGCQNTKATDVTFSSSGVESKTNVLCESTADGKKLENPHSLKSNEMAECSVKPGEEVVFLPTHTDRVRTLGKCQCGNASSTIGPSFTR